MSSSVDIQIICSFCKQDLTEVDGVFCPSCGHTVFKNAVFNSKSKSTNSYDPLGIYTKPWKEKPLIKARVYPAAKEKAQPWYPTMRQPRRAKKPNKLQWKLAADSVPENASQNLEAKEGGEIQSDVPITSPESVPETETQASEVPKEPEIVLESIKERVSPLAAYDLSHEDKKFTAFISLVESLLGNTSTSRSYWLKVALLIAKDNEESESDGEFLTLGFVSNAVGRLMIPNSDDWVELTSIDAREYYMAQHMQKVLSFLCSHIKYREDMSTQGDITYIVEGRDLSQTTQFRAVESVDEFGRVMAGKPTIQILCKHLGNISDENKPSFLLDDRIANFQGSIRLSRSTKFPFCPILVHVQVEYRNSAIINRAALKHKITREDFAKLNEATHLILRIQPDVQNLLLSESIPYAHFTFDNTVLNLMLKGEKSLHEVVELSTENLEHLENYVTRVTNMLRLDYTDQGMKYSLVGAFAEPCFTSIPWPEDIEEQLSKYADLDVVESHPFIEASIPSAVSSSPVPPTPPSEIVNEEEPETVEEPIHVVDEVIVPAPVPVEVVPTAEVEDTEPEYMISEPCPFHGSLGCHCRSSSTFLRGTKIMLYADIGESNTKETFSNSLKNIEENGELFIAAVDTTGDQESYFKDDCYVKGKVSIVTMKNPGLTAFISECGAALSMGASIDDHANLFMEKLVERLDLFKSEAHQLMKLSIKS